MAIAVPPAGGTAPPHGALRRVGHWPASHLPGREAAYSARAQSMVNVPRIDLLLCTPRVGVVGRPGAGRGVNVSFVLLKAQGVRSSPCAVPVGMRCKGDAVGEVRPARRGGTKLGSAG